MTTTDRIREFLARYDACMFRGGTPPSIWLAEAAALLRKVTPSQAQNEGLAPTGVTVVSEDIYRSTNGDHWRLIRDTASGHAFVRHDPNPSSGGRVTHVPVDEFLARGDASPEHVALRHLLTLSNEKR